MSDNKIDLDGVKCLDCEYGWCYFEEIQTYYGTVEHELRCANPDCPSHKEK